MSSPTSNRRGMWVWDKAPVRAAKINTILTDASNAAITDLYLYCSPSDYTQNTSALRAFNVQAARYNIRTWALDGDRSYLADPTSLYKGLNALIAFNASATMNERFFGFQTDIEPNDTKGYTSFHDGIPSSKLTASQASDREDILEAWVDVSKTCQSMCEGASLQYGIVSPFWTMNYYGEPLTVTGTSLTGALMEVCHEFIIMTYNTDPANAASRALQQCAYTSTRFDANLMPRIYASVEVTPGVGANVSYADTPGKNKRSVVLAGMQTIVNALSPYPAFAGMCIEQWSAWTNMADK